MFCQVKGSTGTARGSLYIYNTKALRAVRGTYNTVTKGLLNQPKVSSIIRKSIYFSTGCISFNPTALLYPSSSIECSFLLLLLLLLYLLHHHLYFSNYCTSAIDIGFLILLKTSFKITLLYSLSRFFLFISIC